jgi:hypothetical protein
MDDDHARATSKEARRIGNRSRFSDEDLAHEAGGEIGRQGKRRIEERDREPERQRRGERKKKRTG